MLIARGVFFALVGPDMRRLVVRADLKHPTFSDAVFSSWDRSLQNPVFVDPVMNERSLLVRTLISFRGKRTTNLFRPFFHALNSQFPKQTRTLRFFL